MGPLFGRVDSVQQLFLYIFYRENSTFSRRRCRGQEGGSDLRTWLHCVQLSDSFSHRRPRPAVEFQLTLRAFQIVHASFNQYKIRGKIF